MLRIAPSRASPIARLFFCVSIFARLFRPNRIAKAVFPVLWQGGEASFSPPPAPRKTNSGGLRNPFGNLFRKKIRTRISDLFALQNQKVKPQNRAEKHGSESPKIARKGLRWRAVRLSQIGLQNDCKPPSPYFTLVFFNIHTSKFYVCKPCRL